MLSCRESVALEPTRPAVVRATWRDAIGALRVKEVGVMFRNGLSGLFLSLFALGFALLGTAQRADAQVLFGSVSGTVTDQSGAGVPKTHVTLINKATSIQREADTDESGHYNVRRSGSLVRLSVIDLVPPVKAARFPCQTA